MPQITAMAMLQFALLLSTLPAQYLISKWTSGSAAQRRLATEGILDAWTDARQSYLNVTVWVDWLSSWMPRVPLFGAEDELEHGPGESLAVDLLMRSNDQGYFGGKRTRLIVIRPFQYSYCFKDRVCHNLVQQAAKLYCACVCVKHPRKSEAPEYVLHRVGDVVVEMQNHMVGVIVGWDAGLRAPPEWISRKKLTESEVKRLEDTPHYRILFSGPDSSSLLIGYLPQTVIQLSDRYQPEIPTLSHYFSHFDGKKFVMQGWLKELYPDD